jgi:3' terminal RNA ribose 2'-O-methyltransferase Hen1
MLLTITNRTAPATDLGFLLRKNPENIHTSELSYGNAYVFYPEATFNVCTAALLVDIDPVGLIRGRRGASVPELLGQYVNDRPYAASSFLSVALNKVYSSAMSGQCKAKPELADTPLKLEATISAVPCRGGEKFLRKLFEPLGYQLVCEQLPLDPKFPEWGDSLYFKIHLSKECLLKDLLSHLYVLIPVLDNEKHYWVGESEVDKLLAKAQDWLPTHPEKEAIVHRYLRNQRWLAESALEKLVEEDSPDFIQAEEEAPQQEESLEKKISLNEERMNVVLETLKAHNAHKVVDLGCGEGKLLRLLMKDKSFEEIVGMDVSHRALEIASERLRLEEMPAHRRGRIKLLHGSLCYRDKRLEGFDAAALVEVVEHLDQARLTALERVLFEFVHAPVILVTTPNSEYNVKFENLKPGHFRHSDHRFEWTRAEFQEWAKNMASRFGYSVVFKPIGPDDPTIGPPTQMGIFTLDSATGATK